MGEPRPPARRPRPPSGAGRREPAAAGIDRESTGETGGPTAKAGSQPSAPLRSAADEPRRTRSRRPPRRAARRDGLAHAKSAKAGAGHPAVHSTMWTEAGSSQIATATAAAREARRQCEPALRSRRAFISASAAPPCSARSTARAATPRAAVRAAPAARTSACGRKSGRNVKYRSSTSGASVYIAIRCGRSQRSTPSSMQLSDGNT